MGWTEWRHGPTFLCHRLPSVSSHSRWDRLPPPGRLPRCGSERFFRSLPRVADNFYRSVVSAGTWQRSQATTPGLSTGEALPASSGPPLVPARGLFRFTGARAASMFPCSLPSWQNPSPFSWNAPFTNRIGSFEVASRLRPSLGSARSLLRGLVRNHGGLPLVLGSQPERR